MKIHPQPSVNPSFDKLLKETLNKIYENKFYISYKNLKVLQHFAEKKY
jgi:hypothetical protein